MITFYLQAFTEGVSLMSDSAVKNE